MLLGSEVKAGPTVGAYDSRVGPPQMGFAVSTKQHGLRPILRIAVLRLVRSGGAEVEEVSYTG